MRRFMSFIVVDVVILADDGFLVTRKQGLSPYVDRNGIFWRHAQRLLV